MDAISLAAKAATAKYGDEPQQTEVRVPITHGGTI